MTLRRKLLLTMLIPSLLILLVGVVGILSLKHLENAAGKILANNYRSIKEARRLERLLHRLDQELSKGTVDTKLVEAFENGLHVCEANVTETGETEFLRRIRRNWKLRFSERDTPIFDEGSSAEKNTKSEVMIADLESLMKLNEVAMERSERETRRTGLVMIIAMASSSCLALLGLAVFASISAHRISRPVIEVAAHLHSALSRDDEEKTQASFDTDEIALLRAEQQDLLLRLAHYEDEQNRKLSHLQERFKLVMERVLEGLVFIDSKHHVLAVNRVARTILAIGDNEAERIEDLDLPVDVRKIFAHIGTTSPGAEQDLDELSFVMHGEERIYRPRVLAIPGSKGSIEGYFVLFWDVTEQRRFEEARRNFIAMLSHQLKTPMTSLSMSVNLLKEKLPTEDEEQRELLSIATEDCRNLSHLVGDLIDASKGISSNLHLEPRSVDLALLLRTALRPLMPQADERGIELVLPEGQAEILARVDPVKFPWVVTNITGNALRYTDRGGKVTVLISKERERIEVLIRDTGVGIQGEDVERIFDPHVTLDAVPDRGCHGLGLSIAREIVEAHRGKIWAESQLGEGTTFFIQLPS